MGAAARNLGSNYFAYGAAVLSGLVLTPIIITAIGQEGYGAWVFIISLTTMLRLLDIGITPTVVRFTALHRAQENTQGINTLAASSLAVYLAMGAISLALGVVLAWFLPDMVALSPDLQQPAQVATVIAVCTLATQAPLGLFGNLLKGAQRFDVVNTGNVAAVITYAVLVIAVLTRHSSLPVLATIAFTAGLVRFGYPILFLKRVLPDFRLSTTFVTRGSIRDLLGFSWFAFLGHASGKVVYSADVLVIGAVLGGRQVALYGVAARLFELVAGVASTGTDILLPVHSDLEGRRDHDRQRMFVSTGVRAATSVAVLLGFPLIILPAWVLTAWLGDGWGPSVAPLALLGCAVTFSVSGAVLAQYLFARGKPVLLAVAQAALAITNLTLTAVLLLTVGEIWVAALATLVVEAAGTLIVLPVLARRRGVSLRHLGAAWTLPIVAGLIAALPTLVLARLLIDSTSLLVLAAVGAAWAAAFGAVAWRIALTPDDRALVRQLASRRRSGNAAPTA